MAKEIERQFLIGALPAGIQACQHSDILTGYLAISDDDREVRVRRAWGKHMLTVKAGSGLVREEYQIEISKEEFDGFWPLTEGFRIEKTRYLVPHQNLIIEVDEYRGSLEGFRSAEIEFNSVEASEKFSPPSWFGQEVTFDTRYKNKNLARYGAPTDVG